MQEIWKPIAGYESAYEISSLGRVRSLDRFVRGRGQSMKFKPGVIRAIGVKREGYHFVNLCSRSRAKPHYIHRLVAAAFIDNPGNLPQVNHLDGDKANNQIENLEWCTGSDNCRHAIDSALYQPARGESSGAAKLTESDVREIRRLAESGVMHKDIAVLFCVERQAVTKIASRQRWAHIA